MITLISTVWMKKLRVSFSCLAPYPQLLIAPLSGLETHRKMGEKVSVYNELTLILCDSQQEEQTVLRGGRRLFSAVIADKSLL